MDVKVVDLYNIRCPKCGTVIRYSAKDKQIVCPSCGFVYENDFMKDDYQKAWEEKSFSQYLREIQRFDKEQSNLVIRCVTCGAEVEFDRPVISSFCPYCGNPIVLKQEQIPRPIKPQAIVPFEITKEQAHEKYRLWAKRRWLAPQKFRLFPVSHKNLNSLYIPYWTFDAQTITSYTAKCGTYYYVTKTYYQNGQKKTQTIRKIRWTRKNGIVYLDFDDILVRATDKLPIYPYQYDYDLTKLEPFDQRLLSGYYSEAYTIDLSQSFGVAKNQIHREIMQAIKQDLNCDEQVIEKYNIRYRNVTFKSILLPVYYSIYKFKKKEYPFVINGQTGKVYGKYPISVWKIIFIILFVLLALFLLFVYSEYDFDFSAFFNDFINYYLSYFLEISSFFC